MPPQTFQVLRCYKCSVFQIHQTKNSNKFECKLCGEKQSIKRHYGLGSSKDCRLHVQKLNRLRGEVDELIEQTRRDSDEEIENKHDNVKPRNTVAQSKSKWADYIEEVLESTADVPLPLDTTEVVLEVPKKRKKVSKSSFKTPTILVKANAVNPQMCQSEKICSSKNVLSYKSAVSSEEDSFRSNLLTKEKWPSSLDSSNYNVSVSEPNDGEKIPVIKNEIEAPNSKAPKIFVPLAGKSNSKWAQFVEMEDSSESNHEINKVSSSVKHCSQNNLQTQTLFSLCDDNELDNVLNF